MDRWLTGLMFAIGCAPTPVTGPSARERFADGASWPSITPVARAPNQAAIVALEGGRWATRRGATAWVLWAPDRGEVARVWPSYGRNPDRNDRHGTLADRSRQPDVVTPDGAWLVSSSGTTRLDA